MSVDYPIVEDPCTYPLPLPWWAWFARFLPLPAYPYKATIQRTFTGTHYTYSREYAVSRYPKSTEVTVHYSDDDLAAAGDDPSRLLLAYYDEDDAQWVPVETMVDDSTRSLTTTTTHFSDWMVMAREAPTNPASTGFPLWGWFLMGCAGIAAAGTVGSGTVYARRRGGPRQRAEVAAGWDTSTMIHASGATPALGTTSLGSGRSIDDTLVDPDASGDSVRRTPSSFPCELEAIICNRLQLHYCAGSVREAAFTGQPD